MTDLNKQEMRRAAQSVVDNVIISGEWEEMIEESGLLWRVRAYLKLMPPAAILSLLDELEGKCAEIEELDVLCGRQSDLLSQAAVALRGPEPALTRYSHADIPSRVKAVVSERDQLRAEVVSLKNQLWQWKHGANSEAERADELRKDSGAEMFLTLTREIVKLREEVKACHLLLRECNEVLAEDGGVYIELRAYLSGRLPASEVVAILSAGNCGGPTCCQLCADE